MNSQLIPEAFKAQYKNSTDEDLIAEYLQLDPKGNFFRSNGIHWSDQFNQPTAAAIFCDDIVMDKLLGERQDVPEVDLDYIPIREQVEAIATAQNIGSNIVLIGPPGSSKSSVLEYVAAKCNRPFYAADLHEEFRIDTLKGQMVITKEKFTQFQDGPLTKAFLNEGAIFLADECNLCPPGVLGELHRPFASKTMSIPEDGSRIVAKATGVLMCAAGNAINSVDDAHLHAGIQKMNGAFLDRMGLALRTDYPQPHIECDIVWNAVIRQFPDILGTTDRQVRLRDVISKMIKVANTVRTGIKNGSISSSFSIRKTITWAKAFVYTNSIQQASQMAVLAIQERDDSVDIEKDIKQVFSSEYTIIYGRDEKQTNDNNASTV